MLLDYILQTDNNMIDEKKQRPGEHDYRLTRDYAR